MKIAILADIHLKLRNNKDFEANRFGSLIHYLVDKKYDAVVISGDLFDFARPTLEEQKVVTDGIRSLSSASRVYIIAGNHEAVTKNESTYDFIDLSKYAIVTKLSTVNFDGVMCTLCDWLSLDELKKTKGTDLLLSHWRSNYGFITEEIDTQAIAKKYNKVILGDIHHRHSPLDNVHYCGSPYSTKFVSPGDDKFGYIELDTETLEHTYVDLSLASKYKFKCTVQEVENIVKQHSGNLLRLSVVGTTNELSKLPKDYIDVIYNLIPIHKDESTITTTQTIKSGNSVQEHTLVEHIVKSLPSVTNKELATSVLNTVNKDIR